MLELELGLVLVLVATCTSRYRRASLRSDEQTGVGVIMGNGYWAGDAIASGLEIAGMTVENTQLEKELDRMRGVNAGNLAEKHALRVALAKFDPKHPLLNNLMLQDQIKKQGARAYFANRNWHDASRYGQKVQY